MDTLIERKKRFTPRRIYGGAGVLFILVFVFYFIFQDILNQFFYTYQLHQLKNSSKIFRSFVNIS